MVAQPIKPAQVPESFAQACAALTDTQRATYLGEGQWHTQALPAHEEQLEEILALGDPDAWFEEDALAVLACAYPRQLPEGGMPTADDCIVWSRVKSRYRRIRGYVCDLNEAVEAFIDRMWVIHKAIQPRPPGQDYDGFIAADALLAQVFPPIMWILPGLLPAGATLLVGPEKSGKSFLGMNLAVATATGGKALGRHDVTQGSVLYMALEDGPRRAKDRLQKQLDAMQHRTPLPKLTFYLEQPPALGDGFEEKLVKWLNATPDAKLVILDVLESVRPARSPRGSVYAEDYWVVKPLQVIANQYNIALLILHHSNKAQHDDWRDSASGSRGLTGAVDAHWNLRRMAGDQHAALRIHGREIGDSEWGLEFADGFWTLLDQCSELVLSEPFQNILEALREKPEPQTPAMLSKELGINGSTMRSHLRKMLAKGLVEKTDNGYRAAIALPHATDCATPATHNATTLDMDRPYEADLQPTVTATLSEPEEVLTQPRIPIMYQETEGIPGAPVALRPLQAARDMNGHAPFYDKADNSEEIVPNDIVRPEDDNQPPW